MTNKEQSYDATLISELGVKRYLKATKDIKTSNINFLIRGANANRAWQECNFGCHGPTYRCLKRPSTKCELLKLLDDISPVLGGTKDEIQHHPRKAYELNIFPRYKLITTVLVLMLGNRSASCFARVECGNQKK